MVPQVAEAASKANVGAQLAQDANDKGTCRTLSHGGTKDLISRTLDALGFLLGTVLVCGAAAPAHNLMTLHSFGGGPTDGAFPLGNLTIGPGGVLYGTTPSAGASGNGTVFALTPPAAVGGTWTESVFSFSGGSGGSYPAYGRLAAGQDGIIYGATWYGGSAGIGTIFSLNPPASLGAPWRQRILYQFTAAGDGAVPVGVAIGRHGELYGVTANGGSLGLGTVFRLDPPTSLGGPWSENILLNFTGQNGSHPSAGVTIGNAGDLYGTTSFGGSSNLGTIYRVTPPSSPGAPWTETVLHSFSGNDGATPNDGLVIGSGGIIYGTTSGGGTENRGTAFSLTDSGAAWTETVLFSFGNYNGITPCGTIARSALGLLYGTTIDGGTAGGYGTIFSLTPPTVAGGAWTETLLHSFGSTLTSGANPCSGIAIGNDGILYGTTINGGAANMGMVFAVRGIRAAILPVRERGQPRHGPHF